MTFADKEDVSWSIPQNVHLAPGSRIIGQYIPGDHPFRRFRSRRDPAVTLGEDSVLDGVYFNMGEQGVVVIGRRCQLSEVFLLSDLEIRIGNNVTIGWHTVLADADFHPLNADERRLDAVACSPLGTDQPRRPYLCSAIVIEDDVWIGPNASILKGVRIGAGAWVEPGSVVVHDVPAGVRVLGNPAHIAESS